MDQGYLNNLPKIKNADSLKASGYINKLDLLVKFAFCLASIFLFVAVIAGICVWNNNQLSLSKINNTIQARENAIAVADAARYIAYPASASAFSTSGMVSYDGQSIKPDGVKVVPESAGLSGEVNVVTWACLSTCNKTRGGRITYWDFTSNSVSPTVIYVGDAMSDSSFISPSN